MIYFVILLAVAARFIPHMPNVAPVTALAIFSAVYLPKKQAIAVPLAARFVSDLFLGFFSWPLMLAVYASHLVGVLFGLWIRKESFGVIANRSAAKGEAIYSDDKIAASTVNPPAGGLSPRNDTRVKWLKIIASSLGSSIIFFLVTNFAFLYSEYSHNLSGVIAAYANGLPFFRGTIMGDLGYTIALFGIYQLAVYAKQNRQRANHAIA